MNWYPDTNIRILENFQLHNWPFYNNSRNQQENRFDSLKFSDYDVAKVYIKEESGHVKSPVPYSFKHKNDDNMLKDYIIEFYKLKDGKPDFIRSYDSNK